MDVRQILTDMVNADTQAEASLLANRLRGQNLDEAQELAPRTYCGTVSTRRHQLVQWAFVWAHDSAVLQWPADPTNPERVAFLARCRAARLAELAA